MDNAPNNNNQIYSHVHGHKKREKDNPIQPMDSNVVMLLSPQQMDTNPDPPAQVLSYSILHGYNDNNRNSKSGWLKMYYYCSINSYMCVMLILVCFVNLCLFCVCTLICHFVYF